MNEAQALLQELNAADAILRQLGDEVERQQGTLSEKTRSYRDYTAPGSSPLPPVAQGNYEASPEELLLALRESEVRFGNPVNDLTHLTPELFEALQIPLDEMWRRQMRAGFDFYYI